MATLSDKGTKLEILLDGKGINELAVREIGDNKLPHILERYYDDEGKLNGMAILVQEGTLPLTGKQFAQWYQEKYPQ